jgi:hypothetical protein
LDRDAIDKIADLVRQAQRPPFLVRPGDAQGHVHALQPDGTYLLQENVREPTAITLPSPAAFVEYAKKHLKPNSEIYVGDNEVVLIYDAEDYRGDAARCVCCSPTSSTSCRGGTSRRRRCPRPT